MGFVSLLSAFVERKLLRKPHINSHIYQPSQTMNSFGGFTTVALFALSNMIDAAIWDCGNKYEFRHPESSEGARWVADEERGACHGPGRCYYGSALTWTYKDLAEGQSVWCGNGHFGCDPLPLFKKQCYFVPHDYCCYAENYSYNGFNVGQTIKYRGSQDEVKQGMTDLIGGNPDFPAFARPFLPAVVNEIFNDVCNKPLSQC